MKNLNRVRLNGLRAIEAVGRLGKLNLAADELGVTAGAVSQQIQKTEQQLGKMLFSRYPKGLTLTPTGEEILEHLTKGLSELSIAVSLTEKHQENILTVSVAPIFASKWLVWRLKRFNEKHPDIRIRVDATVSLINPTTSDVDVCIRVGKGGWPGVTTTKLYNHSVFPVCDAATASKIKAPKDIANVPIIRDACEMFHWDTWLNPHGLTEEILSDGPTFSDGALCLDAAIAGQGVFLAWETLANHAIESGQLIAPFTDKYVTGFAYWFVVAQNTQKSKTISKFEKWLRDELNASLP